VIRYCFVENGELLRRLYRFRQENQQPPDELVRSRIEVFSARAIGKRFNVSHNTVLASQVFQYVDAQVLPEVQKSARVSRADVNMAAEIAAIDVQRNRSNDNYDGSARQALIRYIEKSDELQQSVRDSLLQMVSDGWDIEIVRQKLSDFLEE